MSQFELLEPQLAFRAITGLEDPRQCGRTPRSVAAQVVREYRLEIDYAADAESTTCPLFFDREDNSLQKSWVLRGLLNPPFDAMDVWLSKVISEVDHLSCPLVAMFAPATPGVEWWKRAAENSIWFLFDRRVHYEPPPGIKYSSPAFGSGLHIFSPGTICSGSFQGWRCATTGVRL